jgi:hypothetical protein
VTDRLCPVADRSLHAAPSKLPDNDETTHASLARSAVCHKCFRLLATASYIAMIYLKEIHSEHDQHTPAGYIRLIYLKEIHSEHDQHTPAGYIRQGLSYHQEGSKALSQALSLSSLEATLIHVLLQHGVKCKH